MRRVNAQRGDNPEVWRVETELRVFRVRRVYARGVSLVEPQEPVTYQVPTASVPEPHTLVVGSPVQLYFKFTDLPSDITSAASFAGTVTLNGITTEMSLESASLFGTSLMVPYTAQAAGEHVLTLVALGQSKRFVVPASAVFTFPELESTSRGEAKMISVGQPVTLVTTFAGVFPPGATATAVLRPGASSLDYAGTVSGNTVSVTFDALLEYHQKDVTGIILVAYGGCTHEYRYEWDAQYFWYIYRFPDTFSILSGRLEAGKPSALRISMVGSGWDAAVHTQTTAGQFVYVQYTQGGEQDADR
jgi:hypothetical protein